jgi:hypothetical protein
MLEKNMLEKRKPDWFRRFGIWCSGASTEALYECPTAWNAFAIQGYVIFMTAVLSFISGSYFLSFVFPVTNWIIPAAFGAVWAFLIFTLDRSIIVSIKKTGVFWKELLQAFPRFILAVFIGLVIATPIELRLFEPDIKEKVTEINFNKEQERLRELLKIDSIRAVQRQKEVENLKIKYRIDEYEKIMNDKKILYDSLDNQRIQEAEGTGGTGIPGKGPVYDEKQKSFETAKGDYEDAKKKYNVANENYMKEVQPSITTSVNPDTTSVNPKETPNDIVGVETRVRALYQLSGLHWFMTLLFILIECLPVITKLMNKRGPYDETLERIEYEKMIEQKEIISRKNSEINELLKQAEEAAKLSAEIKMQSEQYKLEAELRVNKTILDDIAQKQEELALEAIDKWYQEEKQKLDVSPAGTYVTTIKS